MSTQNTFNVAETPQAVAVLLGLGNPGQRALFAGAVVATGAYLASYPKTAFANSKLKPIDINATQRGEGSGLNFLYLPVGAAVAAYLFT